MGSGHQGEMPTMFLFRIEFEGAMIVRIAVCRDWRSQLLDLQCRKVSLPTAHPTIGSMCIDYYTMFSNGIERGLTPASRKFVNFGRHNSRGTLDRLKPLNDFSI